jgi:large subunit ribosomal protein L32
MAVPKKRTASSKRDMRRSHHAKTRQRLQPCPRCKQLLPAHMACPNCGTYKGREVINVTAALDRAERKYRQKTQHQH